ncbi:hypothetical protein [Sodalinema gerasimenkoae]|uniref:hypothetical protein n=1 Tax=Sodalinema gerasimenkoae TaxID=2862348 RepID=UPI00135A8C6F|nr:hypothetical protein [Sodalinema gerasimenkoae]
MSLEGTAPIIGGDDRLVHWILLAGVGFRILVWEDVGNIDVTVGEGLGGDFVLLEALLAAIVKSLIASPDDTEI